MPVTRVRKDPQTLSMTLEAEFDASPERVWQLWADPCQLERWWGPPAYPATVTRLDLAPGGRVEYFLTGPDGDRHPGSWEVVEAHAPHRLVFRETSCVPTTELPMTTAHIRIEPVGNGRTRMTFHSAFPSLEAMEQILAMGTDEGRALAVGQIDAILAEDAVARP